MADTQNPVARPAQQLCDLVHGIARALADEPDRVRVESDTSESEVAIRLYVSEVDLGKLIGKQGRTARSLRTIVNAAANKAQARCSLDIQADETRSVDPA